VAALSGIASYFVRTRRRLAPSLLLGVLTLGAGLGVGLGLSEGPATYNAQPLAEACNAFKGHYRYDTKQVMMITAWGKGSGDAELARESARLQMDLRGPQQQVPATIALFKIAQRCYELGLIPTPP
jgi:hypothetical protein